MLTIEGQILGKSIDVSMSVFWKLVHSSSFFPMSNTVFYHYLPTVESIRDTIDEDDTAQQNEVINDSH